MPKARVIQSGGLRGAFIAVLLALGALTIWYATTGRHAGHMEEFQSYKNLTAFADEQVWEAYRFALANPSNMLDFIPCFCGCVFHGDTNNRECYIDRFDAQGRPIFDPHASG